MVRVEALRDVAEGEELCVSYIDETEPVAERAKALAAYGFVCACPRCVSQRAETS
jgi:SET domain-containing protein